MVIDEALEPRFSRLAHVFMLILGFLCRFPSSCSFPKLYIHSPFTLWIRYYFMKPIMLLDIEHLTFFMNWVHRSPMTVLLRSYSALEKGCSCLSTALYSKGVWDEHADYMCDIGPSTFPIEKHFECNFAFLYNWMTIQECA